MINTSTLILISLGYLLLLFLIAFVSDSVSTRIKSRLIRSPLIYTLSISVYCTSWTFYGAVGSAARSGIEFVAIYLGPTLVFLGWWFLLRKIVRIAKTYRITSIADFISSRYGKSNTLAVVVTLMAVLGTTPYIALQLKAVAVSFSTITGTQAFANTLGPALFSDTAFWVAVSMAAFTVLFGTRNVGADEHHHGVVAAIAFESLVKLLALVAVGIFVLFFVGEGLWDLAAQVQQTPEVHHVVSQQNQSASRWITLLFLSGTAIICLPRQFQVTVVEASSEDHLRTASWLFPSYLFIVCLFVIPIALTGLLTLPVTADPDMFVLTIPLASGNQSLSTFAFLGGFSSATSMVIVASLALSIMVSNHIVMPTLLSIPNLNLQRRADLTDLLLNVRRVCILLVLGLGYFYYRITLQSDALASIGLISFAGVAQFLPVLVAGLFWRGGTRNGAIAGLVSGFAIWLFTLVLPNVARAGWMFTDVLANGAFGIAWLHPEALFGESMGDPLVHALVWSYLFNIGMFVFVSLFGRLRPIDKLQMTLFVDAFRHGTSQERRVWERSAEAGELIALTERMLGNARAQALFKEHAKQQGQSESLPTVDAGLIEKVELAMAGTVGAASARVLVSGVAKGEALALDEVIQILDETQQVVEYSHKLEAQSAELEKTAKQLQKANKQLKRLDALKDDFLGRVSHELRTPMTSIRSMSEILREELRTDGQETAPEDKEQLNRFLEIIVSECERLTRLLNEILDLSALERQADEPLALVKSEVGPIVEQAVETLSGLAQQSGIELRHSIKQGDTVVLVEPDRLKQVFINLISNALKFNTSAKPFVLTKGFVENHTYVVEIIDNGPGIAAEDHELIFSKFGRAGIGQTAGLTTAGHSSGHPTDVPSGTGLGLAISEQIIRRFNGTISLKSKLGEGATFRIQLPLISTD